MTTVQDFDMHFAWLSREYPDICHRVFRYDPALLRNYSTAYTVFIDNAFHFATEVESANLNLVTELYPGGGLMIGTEKTDEMVRCVTRLPMLSHVITTQPRVTEYLREFGLEGHRVTEILGVVVNESYLKEWSAQGRRKYFGTDKKTLDLLFAAHRYDDEGIQKGYPIFVEICRLLSDQDVDYRAHVVGGHRKADVDLFQAAEKFTFYGAVETTKFQQIARKMDLVLSPNAPFVFGPGWWDGFPTGSCVEAALCGVGVLASDVLGQNRLLSVPEEIVILPPNAEAYVGSVLGLIDSPNGVRDLALNGQSAFRRVYSVESQLWPRLRILEHSLRKRDE